MQRIFKLIVVFLPVIWINYGCQKNIKADTVNVPLIKELKVNKLNLNIKICKWKDNHESALSFSFDDNNWTVKKCAEIFEKYNYRCTFFINPGAYMSNILINDYKKARKEGFEIGNHSYTHARLDTMNINGLSKEISYSKTILNQQYDSCLSFAYPFHLSSELSDSIVKLYHPFCRDMVEKNNDVMVWGNNSLNTYISRVEAIKDSHSKGNWIIFGGHGLDNSGYNPVPSFEIDSLLKFVSIQNIWVETFGKICKYYLTYKTSGIQFSTNKIIINNSYLKELESFQIKDCMVTLCIESDKKLTFNGSNIISNTNTRLQNNWIRYLINVDIMKSNKIDYSYLGIQN